jgi:hypothetical protein
MVLSHRVALLSKLITYARDSPEAAIETERLMSVMTTVKYSPKDYNGTSTHFVTKYVDTVLDYDSRVPVDQQRSDPFKLSGMLQSGVSELNQVKTLYSMNHTITGHGGPSPLTFDTYIPMLCSACTQYDKTSLQDVGNPFRKANMSSLDYDDGMTDYRVNQARTSRKA